MADVPENIVEGELVPSGAAQTDNEAIRQAAVGNQRPSRQTFVPKPVEFLPLDIIKFVDELASQERVASNKVSPALDGLVLGSIPQSHLFDNFQP